MLKFRHEKNSTTTQAGNALIIVLIAIVIVVVGALAYFSGKITGDTISTQSQTVAEAEDAAPSAETTAQTSTETAQAATPEAEPIEIQPGNPVVAKVNGEEINRVDVFNFIQTLPANTRNLPVTQLFPIAREQVINSKIVEGKVKDVNLDNDPAVKEQLEVAKEQIVRTVFLQKEVDKGMTDERMQEAYEAYKAGFPKVEETDAAHILVSDEALAKDLIKQLEDGASFEELAKEYSKDGTAEKGGELGYFADSEVVPAFSEGVKKIEIGQVSKKPIESEYGFHVVKIKDRRMREPASLEQAKPFLEGQLRRALLDKTIADWRSAAEIDRFDINGEPIEETAGDEPPADAPSTEPSAGDDSQEAPAE